MAGWQGVRTAVDLFDIERLQGRDVGDQIAAAGALARLVELVEVGRQDRGYVEAEGDQELFAHLTWSAATVARFALEAHLGQQPTPPSPGPRPLEGLDGGRA